MYRGKYSPERKLQIIQEALQGTESIAALAKKYEISDATLSQWISNYNAIGTKAFLNNGWAKRTSEEKEAAVLAYLNNEGTIREICKRFQISDTHTLRNWILKYNSHEKLKASGTGGTPIMTKGRKTTFEERVEIVQYCISHTHNYAETAEKFGVSYQQARSYTIKYESKGIDGLYDKRGKRKPEEEMNELEKLRAEMKILRAEKERAEMEIAFLKKLDEIEKRWG